MPPTSLYPPDRPQSIGEVLETAVRLFQATLARSVPYSVPLVVVEQLTSLRELLLGRPLRPLAAHDLAWWLWDLAGLAPSVLLWGSLLLRQDALAAGGTASLGGELRATLARLPQLLALVLLAPLAVALGILLLVVPGLYLLAALPFAVPAILLRGSGPIEALGYSAKLVLGQWWRTAAILCIAALLMLVPYVVGGAIAAALAVSIAGPADSPGMTAVTAAVGIAAGAVSVPFASAVILAAFGDLTVRREGVAPAPSPTASCASSSRLG